MCKYCKEKDDNTIYSEIASGYPEANGKARKGFKMTLQRNDRNEVINSREEFTNKKEKFVSYIKAYHWEFNHLENTDHIAVEIQYCPFCGRKL